MRVGDEGDDGMDSDVAQSNSLAVKVVPPSRCRRSERRGLVASTRRSSPEREQFCAKKTVDGPVFLFCKAMV